MSLEEGDTIVNAEAVDDPLVNYPEKFTLLEFSSVCLCSGSVGEYKERVKLD